MAIPHGKLGQTKQSAHATTNHRLFVLGARFMFINCAEGSQVSARAARFSGNFP